MAKKKTSSLGKDASKGQDENIWLRMDDVAEIERTRTSFFLDKEIIGKVEKLARLTRRSKSHMVEVLLESKVRELEKERAVKLTEYMARKTSNTII